MLGDHAARASSCPCRAARRGSSSAAGRTRSPCAAPSPRRAGAPARRTRRASAGACARPAGPGDRRPRRARARGRRTADPCPQYGRPIRCRRDDLQAETADVLARLIRFDTVNPPGAERALPGVAARLPRGRRPRDRALRGRRAGPAEPRGAARRDARRAGARLPVARRHRARRPGRLAPRPVVGRGPRRLAVGPRRDRHEVPDGGRGGRRRRARARGLAARARRAQVHQRRRRGDGRRAGRAVADRAAAGGRARRLAAQRGRRRGDAVRRPPPLRRLLRREGHVPLHACARAAAPATPPCPASPTTRCSSWCRRSSGSAPGRAAYDVVDEPRALPRGHRRGSRRSRRGGRADRARRAARWPRSSSRRSASPSPRR